MNPQRSAIVIGGGIIGLASAWRLAQQGWRVTLLDAAAESREASWAAAGMLAPHHEADGPGPLWRLGVASLERWPAFAAALGGAEALDLHLAGGLLPVLDQADYDEAARKLAFLASAGVACERLDGVALAAAEPALAAHCISALRLPAGHVNPRLACLRLREACAALDVDLRFGTAVSGLDGLRVAIAAGGTLDADEVILASGAWTPALARLAGIALDGEPVKGQLLRFATSDGLLRHFIHSHHAYLVPRRGQGVVVGATMVDSGFDRSQDDQAIARLAAGARRLVPALAQAEIVETWTGLRPRLAGGLPVIARVRPGLILATGHFRNGVLLTPISAEIVACIAAQVPPPCELGPFSCPGATNA
jgi:glycine oxidase